jgi:hypothetical protein
MDKLIKNPVEMRKKISLNVNVTILSLVRDIAKLTKTNNTLVIEALLAKGVLPLFQQFKHSWTAMSIETKDNKKKEQLKELLDELKKISEKKEVSVLLDN